MQPHVAQAGARHTLEQVATWGGIIAEAAGIAVILVGALLSTVAFLRHIMSGNEFQESFVSFRRSLGRAILLGIEFLVAADIVGTVLVDPTYHRLGILGLLVLIRTFLSFTLTVEIEHRWPWQAKSQASSGM